MEDLAKAISAVPVFEKGGNTEYWRIKTLIPALSADGNSEYSLQGEGLLIVPFYVAERGIYELDNYGLTINTPQCDASRYGGCSGDTTDIRTTISDYPVIRTEGIVGKRAVLEYLELLLEQPGIEEVVGRVLGRFAPDLSYRADNLCVTYY